MTTYILHGGNSSAENEANSTFFGEFTKSNSKDEVSILLCYWAREKGEWDSLSVRDGRKIKINAIDKKVNISVAQNADDLVQKIKYSDVLYIAGGTFSKLKKEISEIENFKSLIKDKVIIGSSAGAFLTAKQSLNSFDEQETDINIGLGLLPISILCHWDIENKKEEKLKKLQNYDPKSPIIVLNEAEFIKLYI